MEYESDRTFGDRFFATAGSAFGNLVLLSAIVSAWPQLPHCHRLSCTYPNEPIFVPLLQPYRFRPFIDSVSGYGEGRDKNPRCPKPQMSGQPFELKEAPLPADFDPRAYPGRRIVACVLLDNVGDVAAVRLVGIERGWIAGDLSDTIRQQWSFVPNGLQEASAGWVQVRLNDGPMDAAIMSPLMFH